jgi:hypothetical protein
MSKNVLKKVIRSRDFSTEISPGACFWKRKPKDDRAGVARVKAASPQSRDDERMACRA